MIAKSDLPVGPTHRRVDAYCTVWSRTSLIEPMVIDAMQTRPERS